MKTSYLCCLLLLCLIDTEGDGVGLAEEVLQALLALGLRLGRVH